MNYSHINSKGYELISKLSEKEISKTKPTQNPRATYLGEPEPFNLGEVKEMEISQTDPLSNEKLNRYKTINEKKIGFNSEQYNDLKILAREIISTPIIQKSADINFIEDKIFEWVLEVYTCNKSKEDLIPYILNQIDVKTLNHEFYFLIEAIIIEKEIEIGKVNICTLDSEFLDSAKKQIQEHREINDSEFEEEYKEFIDKILAKVSVKGIEKIAYQNAKDEATLAVNCLKCTLIIQSIGNTFQLPELDFNSHKNIFSNSLVRTSKKSIRFLTKKITGIQPVYLTINEIKKLNKLGLEKLSIYLKKSPSKEIDIEIRNGINKLGETISTTDYHERTVKLISFFESIIIPKDNKKSHGETYLKNNILNFLKEKNERNQNIIRKLYEIRDKYIHNNNRVYIEIETIIFGLHLARIFLLNLIELREKISTQEQLLILLNIKKN